VRRGGPLRGGRSYFLNLILLKRKFVLNENLNLDMGELIIDLFAQQW
jgi:hypothetical protein